MAGPTNRHVAVVPLDTDTERAARDGCAALGCTCGDGLALVVHELTGDERPAEALPYGKASEVECKHLTGCPLIAATEGRN